MPPTALIWGESLVGSGHARVQSALSRALERQGWRVVVITSSRERTEGFDFGGADIVWQEPLRLRAPSADPYKMSNLLTPGGRALGDDLSYQRRRRELLLSLYEKLKPAVVITEMWPFARANFDFELIPLGERILHHGDEKTKLFSIARDIMFPPSVSSPDSKGVDQNRHRLALRYFKPGRILIRGDDSVLPLEISVGRLSTGLRDRLCYVGYFGLEEDREPGFEARDGALIVTSGGGVTLESLELFAAVIRARRMAPLADRLWRILIPKTCPAEAFEALQKLGKDEQGVVVEHNRRDFETLLGAAPLVICHGGNTVIEALSKGARVLVVPREYAKNNREQGIRAKAFEAEGLIVRARIQAIKDPEFLAAKITEALDLDGKPSGVRVKGSVTAASIITESFFGRSESEQTPSWRVFDRPSCPIDPERQAITG